MASHYLEDREKLNRLLGVQIALAVELLHVCERVMSGETDHRLLDTSQIESEATKRDAEIQDLSISIMALYQPVAQDLRHAVSSAKISADLSRIAKLVGNIMERLRDRGAVTEEPVPEDLVHLNELVCRVLDRAVESIKHQDPELANSVHPLEDDVDSLHQHLLFKLSQQMQNEPDDVRGLLDLFSCVHILERIADHAVNMCRNVVFLTTGTSASVQKAIYAG